MAVTTLAEGLAAITFLQVGMPAYPEGDLTAAEQAHVCGCYFLGAPQLTLAAEVNFQPAAGGKPGRAFPGTVSGGTEWQPATSSRRITWRTVP